MYDDMVVIRPPSEASSFLLPVTFGCSNNTCTFCGTYPGVRFNVRNLEDIKQDINRVAQNYSLDIRRVFLENGDALIAPQTVLVEVLKYLKEKFHRLGRVSTYATPKAVLMKSADELQELRNIGLKMAYLGVETGDEALLQKIKKGATYGQIVEAGKKLKKAGIITSVTVILGLGGIEGSEQHARATARILSDIDPEFIGALTLMLVPGTPLHRDWEDGRFVLVSPLQAMAELKLIIQNSNFTKSFFTANHASNYLPIKVRLPRQKAETVALLDDIVVRKDMSQLRPEFIRGL